MTHSFSIYYVEVNEDGKAKIVPHTGKYFKFLDGKKATKFLNDLKARHPDKHFRRVHERTLVDQQEWK